MLDEMGDYTLIGERTGNHTIIIKALTALEDALESIRDVNAQPGTTLLRPFTNIAYGKIEKAIGYVKDIQADLREQNDENNDK